MTITYINPDGASIDFTVTTDANGYFSHTYVPDAVGDWKVYASWPGNNNYFGARSRTLTFKVRGVLRLDFTVSTTIARVNAEVILYAEVLPHISGLQVIFEISKDKVTWNSLFSCYTNVNGSVAAKWIPATIGTYYLRIRVPESRDYSEAISGVIEVEVREVVKTIEEYEHELNETKSRLHDLEQKVQEYEESIEDMNTRITDLENKLSEAESKISQLEQELSEKKSALENAEKLVSDLSIYQYIYLIVGIVIGILIGMGIQRTISRRRA